MKLKSLKLRYIIVFFVSLSILCTNIYAADALYRFMHNDHIALVIGEIVSIRNNKTRVKVEKNIISSSDLNKSAPRKQSMLSKANIVSSFEYGFFYDEQDRIEGIPSVGDYVLMSLEKT